MGAALVATAGDGKEFPLCEKESLSGNQEVKRSATFARWCGTEYSVWCTVGAG